MSAKDISRRCFVGGMAAAAGLAAWQPRRPLWAQTAGPVAMPGQHMSPGEYDTFVKICFNENPYGPAKSVLEAMTGALKYAHRYGSPDGGLVQAIAAHDGVSPSNIILGDGSTEILGAAGTALLAGHKKVIGVEPTFGSVYEHATGIKADAVRVPLRDDFRQDIPALIKTVKDNHPDVGFVYLCNPNNPTGAIVTKAEVRELLDGIPADVPVLIDEAYHHFVEDPEYATSVPYVLEGRQVIVARTFSKIAALAGMRLGYGIVPENLIARLRPHVDNLDVNTLAKAGGAAALKDTAGLEQARSAILRTRKSVVAELTGMGYRVIPSEANFFMVHLRRPVRPVISAFRERAILVGRPFPPLLEHLRVSVGTPDEMSRFMKAFKEIMV